MCLIVAGFIRTLEYTGISIRDAANFTGTEVSRRLEGSPGPGASGEFAC